MRKSGLVRRIRSSGQRGGRAATLAVALAVGTVGVVLTLASRAATPVGSVEAEVGTLASGATAVSDSNASGGQAVKFAGTQTGGGGGSCSSPSNPPIEFDPGHLHTDTPGAKIDIGTDGSSTQDGYSFGNFYVTNDTWNTSYATQLWQVLYACNYNSWYAVAGMNNNDSSGAVKTYPNVHQDFINWGTGAMPKISTYSTITSTYAEPAAAQLPQVGIYEYAYDIWLNGVADGNSTEVMIWNINRSQVPSGSKVATFTDTTYGATYDVYKAGTYIAFVGPQNATGSVDLLKFFNFIISKGWIASTSTIGQICYGVELVSTNNQAATFPVTGFSLTAN